MSKNKIGFKWILLLKNLQTINSFFNAWNVYISTCGKNSLLLGDGLPLRCEIIHYF